MKFPVEPQTQLCRMAAVALGVMTALLSAEHLFAQSSRNTVPAVIRSVQVEAGPDGATTIIVQATSALPEPSTGVAATPPPRIYLDFTDVLPDLNLQAVVPTGGVKAVRVAEHSATPLVTRLVINLVRATGYRVDSSARGQGRIAVLLGGPSSEQGGATPSPTGPVTPSAPATSTASPSRAPASPRPSAQSPAAPEKTPAAKGQQPSATGQQPSPAASTPSPQSSAPAPASRGRSNAAETQYGVRISSALVRLHALRPLLEAIDRRADSIPGDLDAAAAEFDSIGKLLSGIKPPSSREATHALLLRTCTFGARAVRIRQEASAAKDGAKGWDAASAAAGAMMMFDKANADLAK